MISRLRPVVVAAGLAAALVPRVAAAHPHVFVDAKVEIVFDKNGRMTAVRNIWQFDQAFTEYAVQGLDTNGDGKLSDAELQPLAKVNVDSLEDFEFFTYLTVGNDEAKFLPPKEYWLEFHQGQLTLFYTLPLAAPMAPNGKTTLEIFDPEYFVAFDFVRKDPIKLSDAPKGCTAIHHPPKELDASTMATLAAIPVDQHNLPPNLVQVASVLANYVSVECPGSMAAAPQSAAEAALAEAGTAPATDAPKRTAAASAAAAAVESDGGGPSNDALPADAATSPQADAAANSPAPPSPADAAANAPATQPSARQVAEASPAAEPPTAANTPAPTAAQPAATPPPPANPPVQIADNASAATPAQPQADAATSAFGPGDIVMILAGVLVLVAAGAAILVAVFRRREIRLR